MLAPTWEAWSGWARLTLAPNMSLRTTAHSVFYARHYPALTALIGVPQDPRWHPEGDAFAHTLYVADAAVEIAVRDRLSDRDRTVLMLAAVCHDFGKTGTTETHPDGRISSYGHEAAGVPLAEAFLQRIGTPADVTAEILPLVREHMAHIAIVRALRAGDDVRPMVADLLVRLGPARLDQLVRLIEADMSGRPPLPLQNPAAPLLAVAATL